MSTLKVVSTVKQDEVVGALNITPLEPEVFAKVQRHHSQPYMLAQVILGQGGLFRSLGVVDRKTFLRQVVATRLRAYADEWIDTGIVDGGGEAPAGRSLMRAPNAVRLLRDYAKRYRPRLRFFPKVPEFILERDSDDSLPSHVDAIMGHRTWNEATRLFVGLMMSDWGERLCKCRYEPCGKYFVKDRLRKKDKPYTHGTFCTREHQRDFSARVGTKESRERVKNEIVRLAAKQLLKWGIRNSGWQRDAKLKRDLASALEFTTACRRRLKTTLKVNWVTRHQREIEQIRAE